MTIMLRPMPMHVIQKMLSLQISADGSCNGQTTSSGQGGTVLHECIIVNKTMNFCTA